MSDQDTNSPVALTGASTVIPRVASSVADQADTEEFLDGFLRVEAEVRAVPKDARIAVNLDVVGAVATALGALRKSIRPGNRVLTKSVPASYKRLSDVQVSERRPGERVGAGCLRAAA